MKTPKMVAHGELSRAPNFVPMESFSSQTISTGAGQAIDATPQPEHQDLARGSVVGHKLYPLDESEAPKVSRSRSVLPQADRRVHCPCCVGWRETDPFKKPPCSCCKAKVAGADAGAPEPSLSVAQ